MSGLVSVIIPTYNRYHFLGIALDSLLYQSYTKWECLIVDDGSKDYTNELLQFYTEKDSRIKNYLRPHNLPKGANSCRNYGFELSKGEYIQWFDSDDVMLKDFLKSKVEAFTSKIQLVICSGYFVTDTLIREQEMNLISSNSLYKSLVLWERKIITNSVMLRKKFLFDKSLFKKELSRSQEYEFFTRLFYDLEDYEFLILNRPLFLYRQHSESKSFKNKVYRKDYRESISYIAFENMERAISIFEEDLIAANYEILMENFVHALQNDHHSHARYILARLAIILKGHNLVKAIELFIFGKLLLLLNRRVYRIENIIRYYR